MNKENIEDLIDRYVMNRMDDDERRAFENRMAADDALREEVEMMRMILESLERRSMNEAKMARWRSESELAAVCAMPARASDEEDTTRSRTQRQRSVFRIVSICAAACVMLGLFICYPYSYYGLQDDEVFAYLSRFSGESYSDAMESMWEMKAYDEAVAYVDSKINELMETVCEEEYDSQARDFDVYCLSWARIQTFVKMKDYKAAYESLEEFKAKDGVYKEKAEKLYRKLRFRVR